METSKERYARRPKMTRLRKTNSSQHVADRATKSTKMTSKEAPEANSQVNTGNHPNHSEPITERSFGKRRTINPAGMKSSGNGRRHPFRAGY